MVDFPIFNTKDLSDGKTYDLNDPVERHKYFDAKLGKEIEALKGYLDSNTFVGFLLAKKGAGKGTYSSMFREVLGEERVAHVSVGDVVREAHKAMDDLSERQSIMEYMEAHYRGFMALDDAIDALLNRSTSKLIPSEFILTLVKMAVEKKGGQAVFIDGFPRNMDQISYSLYFRDLINMRDDPDFFVLFNTPETILDARIKTRVICPLCKNPHNPRLHTSKFVGYDQKTEEFYLICDNPACDGYETERMVRKEGDDLGIEAIRDRLETAARMIEMATDLKGIPLVFLRNSVPVDEAKHYVEEYELTPEYYYEYDNKTKGVKTLTRPWVVRDDGGIESYSLLPAAMVVSLISQVHDLLLG
jgi:adenylate kinase family enzyme